MKDIGVNVVTEARATKVTDKAISIYDKGTKTTSEHPYGLIVWATGVVPGPLVQGLIRKIPAQGSYRSIKTDSQCQVIGAPGIYALGDCADIDLRVEHELRVCNVFDEIMQKFPSGTGEFMSLEAHQALVDALHEIFGGAVVSAPGAKIAKEIDVRLSEAKKSLHQEKDFQGLSKDEVKEIINKHMDRQKLLPPTAQVAHQQGSYMASLLNYPEIDPQSGEWTFHHGKGFQFRDLGQLVYVGGHMAALSIPATKDIEVAWNGSMTNYIWHAAYFGMLESISTQFELLFDWARSSLFGRSTALDALCTADSSRDVGVLRRGTGGTIEEKKSR